MANFDLDLEISAEFDKEMEFEDASEITTAAPEATPLEDLPGFDVSAGSTWIYPSNMSHRQYQFDIVESCLFKNTLVCLPTGLGKTFIAAVVMYNFYRWYPRGKIVFMAPTKPLVAQQIEACFKVMGIPQDDTKEMTGNVQVGERSRAWTTKRVFFLTPQVMSNDLSRGSFPARDVKLLIVDEAHRAQGEYAYCQVVKEMVRAEAVTRIVALSATPGTDIPKIKEMLQSLQISHIEMRKEDSPDIIPYTHNRIVDKIVVKLSPEILSVRQKLYSVMEIYLKRLSQNRAIRNGHNPTSYKKWVLLTNRTEWRQNPPANAPSYVRGMVEGDFATSVHLYHGLELLECQGLRSFFNYLTKEIEEDDRSNKRIKGELNKVPQYRDIIATLTEQYSEDLSNSLLNQGPVLSQQGQQRHYGQEITGSHPKMTRLVEVVRDHFRKFSETKTETRVIIFSEFRDCVKELVALLDSMRPTVRPMPFVGQSGAGKKKGLTQKEQIEVVRRFKQGGYNTIVATCVAEEGLDIGEVDLIVLYDVAKSPIRLVQRMGRTGRKRDGRIVVLLTEGKEESSFKSSVYKQKAINKDLEDMGRLESALAINVPRMVPRGLNPKCHKMEMLQAVWQQTARGEKDPAITGAFRRTTKYDKFAANCGFLTAIEEERWAAMDKFEGNVKRLKVSCEFWAEDNINSLDLLQTQAEEQDQYDLREYSLWQCQEQNRAFVSPGSLSNVYTTILKLRARKHELAEEITALRGREKAASTDSTREKRPSGNSIKNYFSKSQDRSLPNEPINFLEAYQPPNNFNVIEEENEVADMDIDVLIKELDPVVENHPQPSKFEEKSELSTNVEESNVNLESEDMFVAEMMPEKDDSGVFSLSSSPPSIQKLLCLPQPSHEDIDRFEFGKALRNALKKYNATKSFDLIDPDIPLGSTSQIVECKETLSIPPQAIITHPVEKENLDESVDDIFGDSSLFDDVETPEESKSVKDQVPQANFDFGSPIEAEEVEKENMEEDGSANLLAAKSQFDLGSPFMEEEQKNAECSYFEIGSPIVEEVKKEIMEEDGSANLLAAKSQFDLGSPFMDEEQKNAECSYFEMGSPIVEDGLNEESRFDIGSPIMTVDNGSNFEIGSPVNIDVSDEPKAPRPGSDTSTPISSSTNMASSLRKSLFKQNLENHDERKPSDNMSEDMFEDESDEGELFNTNMEQGNYPQAGDKDNSLFSVTAMVSLMNETNLSPKAKKSISKKKLSMIFRDVNDEDGNGHESNSKTVKPVQSPNISTDAKLSDSFTFDDSFDENLQSNALSPPQKIDIPEESENLLSGLLDDDAPVVIEDEPEAKNKKTPECPICGVTVKGDVNAHIDLCLNDVAIQKMTQAGEISLHDQDLSRSNNDRSPSGVARDRSSPETSPLIRRSKKRPNVLASQTCNMESVCDAGGDTSSSLDESREKIVRKKQKKARGRQFIESEAELSGDNDSGDEAEDTQDHYDQSFVDDGTQATDHAVYLRSLDKSPEFRRPRALPPVTEDIFSQAVNEADSDNYYEEDSFCVGDSMVEDENFHDTLDILEQRAEMARRGKRTALSNLQPGRAESNGKRRRIITHSSDEETFIREAPEPEPEKHVKRKRIVSSITSSDEEIPSQTERIPSSPSVRTDNISGADFLSDSMLESQKLTIVVNTSEVNRSQDLISTLKHVHQLRIIVKKFDLVTFVSGLESAIVRMSESEFNLGTNKDKLVKRVADIRESYRDLTIIIEWEKVKPGERPKTGTRTKKQDEIMAQLVTAGVRVLFSAATVETAEVVSRLVRQCEARELAIPRVKFTRRQEEMVDWLQDISGLSLGSAFQLSVIFSSLRELVTASREVMVSKGVSRMLAEKLVMLFNKSFQEKMTEMAPL